MHLSLATTARGSPQPPACPQNACTCLHSQADQPPARCSARVSQRHGPQGVDSTWGCPATSRCTLTLVACTTAVGHHTLPPLPFPRFGGAVTAEDLYRAMNVVRPGLIRVEADEVTYPMHVVLRYELERGLLDGEFGCMPGCTRGDRQDGGGGRQVAC
eukprot:250204-Chlamydomonas_euryale.AAC.4